MADVRDLFSVENEDASSKDYSIMRKGVDESGGNFLDNMGRLFAGGVETVDNMIQTNIQKDVFAEKDQADMEFGIVGASAQEQSTALPQKQPEELQRAKENLARHREAVRQGKLDSGAYALRADSVVRQLRVKYPGYREQIDKIVQNEFGIDPANEVRRRLEADMDETSRNEAARIKGYTDHYESLMRGMVPSEVTRNVATKLYNGEVPSPGEWNQFIEQHALENNAPKNLENQLKVENIAKDRAGTKLKEMSAQQFSDILKVMLPEHNGSLIAFTQKAMEDGEWSPEEKQQAAMLIQTVRNKMHQSILGIYDMPEYDEAGMPTGATRRKYLPDMNAQLKYVDELLETAAGPLFGKGDISLSALLQMKLDTLELQKKYAIASDPKLLEMAIASDTFGRDYALAMYNNNESRGAIASLAANLTARAVLKGTPIGTTLQTAVAEAESKGNPVDPNEFRALIKTITSGDLEKDLNKPADRVKLVNSILDIRDNPLTVFDRTDRLTIFKEMMNPKFIENVKKHGDANTERMLPAFLTDSFRKIFANEIGEVADIARDDAGGYQLSYDPKKGFSIARDSSSGSALAQIGTFGAIGYGIPEVNAFMRSYNAALADTTSDEQRAEYTKRMLEEVFSINTRPDSGGGFWYKAYQGVNKWLSGDKSGSYGTDGSSTGGSYGAEDGATGGEYGIEPTSGDPIAEIYSNPRNLDVAAKTIAGEARGESPEGRQAIGEVLRNRSLASGRSVAEEARKASQFSVWNEGDPNRGYVENLDESDPNYIEAQQNFLSSANSDLTKGATHYYNPSVVTPEWAKGGNFVETARIGNHRFGYLRKGDPYKAQS